MRTRGLVRCTAAYGLWWDWRCGFSGSNYTSWERSRSFPDLARCNGITRRYLLRQATAIRLFYRHKRGIVFVHSTATEETFKPRSRKCVLDCKETSPLAAVVIYFAELVKSSMHVQYAQSFLYATCETFRVYPIKRKTMHVWGLFMASSVEHQITSDELVNLRDSYLKSSIIIRP